MQLKEYNIVLNKGDSLLMIGRRGSGGTYAIKELINAASQHHEISEIHYICPTMRMSGRPDFEPYIDEVSRYYITLEEFTEQYQITQNNKYRIVIFDDVLFNINEQLSELFTKIITAGLILIVKIQSPMGIKSNRFTFDYICACEEHLFNNILKFWKKFTINITLEQTKKILQNLPYGKLLTIHRRKKIFFYKQGHKTIYTCEEIKEPKRINLRQMIDEMFEDHEKPVESITIEI